MLQTTYQVKMSSKTLNFIYYSKMPGTKVTRNRFYSSPSTSELFLSRESTLILRNFEQTPKSQVPKGNVMDFEQFVNAERLEKDGKKDEALLAYSEFIEQQQAIEPAECFRAQQEKLALAYNNRGFLNYLQVEFKLAVQDYTQALAHNPSLAVAYYNRGLIHYRLSRFSEAVEDMQKALSLKPDLESAQRCLQQSRVDLESKERECQDQS